MNQQYIYSNIKDKIVYNEQGLIPVITQCYQTNDILMLAYMNERSLKQTLETGEMYYHSRSRNELWHKGATSGHIQRLQSIHIDCDYDTILAKVEQIGNIACHTGARSCFFNQINPK